MAKHNHAISKLGTQLSSQKDKFDSLKEKFESEKSSHLEEMLQLIHEIGLLNSKLHNFDLIAQRKLLLLLRHRQMMKWFQSHYSTLNHFLPEIKRKNVQNLNSNF
jgi:hypothetical protein